MRRKFTLCFDADSNQWVLKHNDTEKTLKAFKSKEYATKAGVLRKHLGKQGGTVIVRTKTGMFEEERNFLSPGR